MKKEMIPPPAPSENNQSSIVNRQSSITPPGSATTPSPGGEGAQRAGEGEQQTPRSADSPTPARAPSGKDRKDILDEAAIKLGTGVKNSAELVAYWCMYDNPDQIRTQYKLLRDRLAEVHAILKDQIENLPEL